MSAPGLHDLSTAAGFWSQAEQKRPVAPMVGSKVMITTVMVVILCKKAFQGLLLRLAELAAGSQNTHWTQAAHT